MSLVEPLFTLRETIPLFVVIPILMAVVSNFFYKRGGVVKVLVSMGMIALVALPFLTTLDDNYYVFGAHPEVTYFLGEGVATAFNLGIAYQYTQVQLVILLAFAVMVALSVGVALVFREKVSGVYLFLILMAISCACAIALVDDLFNLFVFFEICTVAQAGMVAWLNEDGAFRTALKYMLLGSVAGGMLLLAVAFLLGSTGVLNVSDMYEMFTTATQRDAPMIFMGLALLVFTWTYGGGLPPFHTIKSELYARASGEAGAVLQAISKVTLIAVGIIIVRLFFWQDVTWQAMMVVSTFAMMIGAAMAMVQNDYRRLIAYIAVNQAGIVGLGLSFYRRLPVQYGPSQYGYAWGHEGMAFGIFHGFNEIIITSALFISAAVLLYTFGHTRIPDIRGIAQRNKEFAILTLFSMLAVSGVPPLNAFQSEWRLIQFAFQNNFMVVGLLMVVSTVMVFFALAKAFVVMFLRPLPMGEVPKPMEVPFAMILVLMVAVVLEIFFGIFPEIALEPIEVGLAALFGG